MSTVTIGTLPVGAIVRIPVVGGANDTCNFIVAHHGRPSELYDSGFIGGTVLLMEKLFDARDWNAPPAQFQDNDYENSTVNAYLNGAYLNAVSADIRNHIVRVKIPFRPGAGKDINVRGGSAGLSAKVFLLSCCEVNIPPDGETPADGSVLSYFAGASEADYKRAAGAEYVDYGRTGIWDYWWLRTPTSGSIPGGAWAVVNTYGLAWPMGGKAVNWGTYGVRPAFVLPDAMLVNNSGLVTPPPFVPGPDMDVLTLGSTPRELIKAANDNFSRLGESLAAVETGDASSGTQGQKGDKGEKGDTGTPGKDGKDGAPGTAATVTVGTTTTLPAGSAATVTNTGTESAAFLNFSIPAGKDGKDGAPGADGKPGTDGKNGQDGAPGATGTSVTPMKATSEAEALSLSAANPGIYWVSV